MIRTLNFICLVMTGLVCLGMYRLAEEARIAKAELTATRTAIKREQEALTVLGAEWARITQPSRIHALADKHLDLLDRPALQLASLTQLPMKTLPLPNQGEILTAKATMPAGAAAQARVQNVAFVPSTPVQKPRSPVAMPAAKPVQKPQAVMMVASSSSVRKAQTIAIAPSAPVQKPQTIAIARSTDPVARLKSVAYAPVSVAPLPTPRAISFTPGR